MIIAAMVVCHALIVVLLASSCMAGNVRTFDAFRTRIEIGQSKQSIRALLGTPDNRMSTSKSNRFIWGPEEVFWDEIPMGTMLEIRNYRFSDGSLNLYFVEESEKLDYLAFAPRGRIY